ncbi:hypothetical protein EV361DRAFT_506096 [Lentinula raphanica]|nr:hypothetical protein EV361DRAFT_506096 [Lentinula raphanica]
MLIAGNSGTFIQGGFIPDLILYLSYFYTKNELPLRLALFWMSSNLCSIVGSFIAFGVLHMSGVLGHAGWRWLFMMEFVPSSSRIVFVAKPKLFGRFPREQYCEPSSEVNMYYTRKCSSWLYHTK